MSAPVAAVSRRLEGPLAWRMSAERLRTMLLRRVGAAERREPDIVRLLAEAPQAVPRLPPPAADLLPRFALASLAVHALIVAAALWRERQVPPASHEIAVELVQAPDVKPKPAQPEAKQEPKPKPEPHQKPPPPQKAQPRRSAKATRRPPPAPTPPVPDTPSSMPVQALPGASDAAPAADAVSYSQLVLSKLAKAKKDGRYMGVPGYAGVRFRVADDGSLESVKLVTSSGDPALETEAIAMVRRAAPYPPPPPGGRRDYGVTLRFEARP